MIQKLYLKTSDLWIAAKKYPETQITEMIAK
jgi:hypothetical protein